MRTYGCKPLARIVFAVALLGGSAPSWAAPDPVETEQRREQALAALGEVARGASGAVVVLETEAGDPLGLGTHVGGGRIVGALEAMGDLRGDTLRVRSGAGTLAAKVSVRAEALGVAIIQAEAPTAGARWPALPRRESDPVRVGRWIVVVGPGGAALAAGLVSAVGREVKAEVDLSGVDLMGVLQGPQGPTRSFRRVIQHDATSDPRMLGAALLDIDGRLLGVHVGGAYRGTSYAVAIEDALAAADGSPETAPKAPPRAALGVLVGPCERELRQKLGLGGVGCKVHEVEAGGAAAAAGLEVGDVILTLDGARIDFPEALGPLLERKSPGDAVAVTLARGGELIEAQVVLGARPGE